MDSTSITENNSTDFRAYTTQKAEIFKKILNELEKVSKKSKEYFRNLLIKDDRIDNNLLELYQFEIHGYAWFETYRIGLRETYNWYTTLVEANKLSGIDANILIYSFAEYLSQMKNGIMISQTEMVRNNDLGLNDDDFGF